MTEPTTTDSGNRVRDEELVRRYARKQDLLEEQVNQLHHDYTYERNEADTLREQVRLLTADKQAWMAENTDLLTQVRSLTAELAEMESAAKGYIADYRRLVSILGGSPMSVHHQTVNYIEREARQLREQVERLTEALEHIRDFKPNTEGVPAEMRVLARAYLTGAKEA